MDGYTFIVEIVKAIASMIGTFAWPTGIFFTVWLFRSRLNELLPLLIFKYRDWQISFGLDKAEEKAENLPATTETHPQPSVQEKARLDQLAILSPRAAIMEARAGVEQAVNNFAQAVGLSKTQMPYPAAMKELERHELIDRNVVALLNELRQIGNAAAHNMTEPSVDEALRYQELAGRLIRQFDIATGASQMPPPGPIPR